MSRDALSAAAGLSATMVSRFELRKGFPRLPSLEKIADALRVPSGWLAYGTEGAWDPAEGLRCAGLAQRCQEARAALGISLREIERKTQELSPPPRTTDERKGITEGMVRGIERGAMPTIDTLENLARALQVSPSWLGFGEGPRELPARQRGAKMAGASA